MGKSASVGPFARLRPGAVLEEGAFVGNFVEIKNATLGEGAKASHLSYIGDTDGRSESQYWRQERSRATTTDFLSIARQSARGHCIGSNSALVAPVNVGNGAVVAAGSVITVDVSPDALALGRGRQAEKEGWAASFRVEQQEKKDRPKSGKD